jgi:hypothetical protein
MRPDVNVAGSCIALVLCACASGSRVTFSPNGSFSARPGPLPPVYLSVADIPPGPLQSAGLIHVRGGPKSDAPGAARSKGAELGCQFIIEHHAFIEHGRQATRDFGVRIYRTHGGLSVHDTHPKPRSVWTFDCVFATTDIHQRA